MKSENHEICRDVMVSHMEVVIKKKRIFRTFCHVGCLQIELSHKKNRSVPKDSIRFGVKEIVELWIVFKTFCIHNRHHRLVHVKFWLFFEFVW